MLFLISVYRLIKNQPVVTTPAMTTTEEPRYDYAQFSRQVPISNEMNPFVFIANDYYYASSIDNLGGVKGVSHVQSDPLRRTPAVRIDTNASTQSVKHLGGSCAASEAGCADGFSAGFWTRLPADSKRSGVLVEVNGIFQLSFENKRVKIFGKNCRALLWDWV